MLHVFHREHAGRPRRVLWLLEEIGEPYELTIMNWKGAACLHLADLCPEAGLIGGLGTYARALAYQWSIFAPAELEPPLIEAAIFREAQPERAAKARGRFFKAAGAVEQSLDGDDYLVDGRFGVADVLVSTALSFAKRAKFPERCPPVLDDYLTKLSERPAYQRAVERASAAPASS